MSTEFWRRLEQHWQVDSGQQQHPGHADTETMIRIPQERIPTTMLSDRPTVPQPDLQIQMARDIRTIRTCAVFIAICVLVGVIASIAVGYSTAHTFSNMQTSICTQANITC